MIIDWFFNLVDVVIRGILSALPDITSFPDSFEYAWEFLATSFGQFLYFLSPDLASTILFSFQTIVFVAILFFSWWGFTTIWGLIRG